MLQFGRRHAGAPLPTCTSAALWTAERTAYPSAVPSPVVRELIDLVERLNAGGRALVAIDGPDAAGKTVLAGRLTAGMARPVLAVSVDAWHNPREVRLRKGAQSPEGYYTDAFDHAGLVHQCLVPFASGEALVRTAGFDRATDHEVVDLQEAPHDAVLVVDGVFLLRPELRGHWDLAVYLHVPESVTLSRAVQRDLPLFGDEQQVRHRHERRYLPGQALYRQDAAPLDHADVVLDNSDPTDPVVLRWPGTR